MTSKMSKVFRTLLIKGPSAMPNWVRHSQNRGATTLTCWRLWDPCLPFYASGLSSYSLGWSASVSAVYSDLRVEITSKGCWISRPAVVSYVSLAFGRYVVEPVFAPCPAPAALIKLVSILGVSEWFFDPSPCTTAVRSRRPRAPL